MTTELTETRKPLHDCPGCTCGQIELNWSDRLTYAFPDDYERLADIVIGCLLDHSYDRPDNGVPYGFDSRLRDQLQVVIAWHLRNRGAWQKHDVELTEEERKVLRDDILVTLKDSR